MSFFDAVPSAPRIRPALNVGGVIDIVTGSYHIGKHGESILNGGMAAVNSVAGPGNTFKSELLNHLTFTPLARYGCAKELFYDSENSMTFDRLNRAAHIHPALADLDVSSPTNSRFRMTQSADMLGDVFFEKIKDAASIRRKIKNKLQVETPFVDTDTGEYITMIEPTLIAIDSLSEWKATSVQEKLVDKNAVGESGANTQFMKDGAAKTQMITQLPNLAGQGGLYFFMVAHVGMPIVMDQYAPVAAKLTHARAGTKTKGVPEKFDFINSNLFEIYNAKVLYNSSQDKTAKYPKGSADREIGTPDLTAVYMVNTRNKGGPSGVRFEMLVSQSEGYQATLTEFHFVKTSDNYGVVGNNVSYAMALRPDVKLGRTTVRTKIDEDYRLCRAIEITAQMKMMENIWRGIDPELHISPEALYEKLKDKYDWDILLNTRGYWVFVGDEDKELPFLSTMDLLNMAAGTYHPWWYDGAVKAKDSKGSSK